MSVNVNSPILVGKRTASIDEKWGPYNSVQEAINVLQDDEYICAGLKFGVKQSDGSVKEYQFKLGVANESDVFSKEDEITGWTSSQINALIDILKKSVYTEDKTEDINNLASLLFLTQSENEIDINNLPFISYLEQTLTTIQQQKVLSNLGIEIATIDDINNILNQ